MTLFPKLAAATLQCNNYSTANSLLTFETENFNYCLCFGNSEGGDYFQNLRLRVWEGVGEGILKVFVEEKYHSGYKIL